MKKIFSVVLSICLLLSSLSITAFATDSSGLVVSSDRAKPGEEFTLNLHIEAIAETLSTFQYEIDFDYNAFELKEYTAPDLTGGSKMTSIISTSNTNGKVTATYTGSSYGNDIDMTAGFTATMKFAVRDSATTGSKTFTLTKCGLTSLQENGYTEINRTPASLTSSVTLNVVSEITGEQAISITAPVKGGTPQSTIAEGTGYTGTISWTPSDGTFAGDTVYTATVELTAKSGYQFAATATASVSGATISEKAVESDGSKLKFKATFPATAGADALSGTVSITGTAKFGETLTANTTSLNYGSEGAGTLSYQWYRGDTAISGATSNTYTLVAADVGQTIKVQVKNSNNSGSVTSDATAAVAKADGPAAPTLAVVEKTDKTITVTANSDWEYSINNGSTWQNSNTFTGLEPNTTYSQIVARVKATATQEASANSAVISVTTDKGTADSALQAELKGALTPYNAVYDKAAHDAFTVGTLPAGWSATYSTDSGATYSSTMPKVTNVADSTTISVKFSNANYSAYVTSYEVTVTAKPLTDAMVELGTAPTYNGSSQSISITVKDGAALTKDIDYTVSGTTALTDVAASAVTVTITGMGNYSGTVNKTWNLQKATPVITAVESKSIVNNVATSLGATIEPDTLPLTYESADTSKVTVSADGNVMGVELTGETPVNVTVSFAGNGNYNPASKTVAVTVTDKTPVTVTFAGAASKTYTGSAFQLGAQFTAATVDGGKPLTGYKYGGNTYTDLEALKAVEVTNAGTYTVTAYYESATEYGERSATFTISKADQAALSINSADTMKYGEKLTLTTTGGSGTGAVTYTFTNGTGSAALNVDELTATGVGTVTVKATKAGDANYNDVTSADQTITISKADQTITANDVSATYGDTNAKVTAATSGNGTISYAVKSGSEDCIAVAADGTLTIKKVGTAYVTVSAEATDNFNSATEEVTVTIAPKAITAPTADTKTYTYNGKAQTYGVTTTADFTVSDNATQTNAGTYTITAALNDKVNTVWADTNGTTDKEFNFVIGKTTITITAKNKTAYVGDAVPALSESDYTVAGLAESETLKKAPTIAYTSTPDMTKSGSVVIKVSGAEAPVGDNYEEIAYVNGTLTIITKSSGGGGGVSTYSITAEPTEHGAISVSPKNASKGTTVTVTVKPDEGYELDALTATDGSGKAVAVTEKDGKYTFTMPASKVSVKATFKEAEKPVTMPFADVAEGAWYYDSIKYVYSNGMMVGTGDTKFSPNATTTRGMIVTILYRLEGEPAVSGTNVFNDVAEGKYYANAVKWAAENEIVSGYGYGNFGPEDPISREQMAAILYRYAAFKGLDMTKTADLSKFTDSGKISDWSKAALSWANAEGLVNGKGGGILDPLGEATRAEIATILRNFCENVVK